MKITATRAGLTRRIFAFEFRRFRGAEPAIFSALFILGLAAAERLAEGTAALRRLHSNDFALHRTASGSRSRGDVARRVVNVAKVRLLRLLLIGPVRPLEEDRILPQQRHATGDGKVISLNPGWAELQHANAISSAPHKANALIIG